MSATGILIAEYDKLVLKELTIRLEGLGYKVLDTAASGEAVIKKIDQLIPDLILMNIRLKGSIDGIQTGSLIRNYRDIPIVYMVDFGSQATIRRVSATGPFGYIFKPFDDKYLFATIETALVRHRLEYKLHQSRQWLNTTLTSIGDGVIATDEYGKVRFINPAAMRLTGWNHTDVAEKPLTDIFCLVDETSKEPINLLSADGSQSPSALREGFAGLLIARDKKTVPVEANITSIQDGRGRIYGRVLIFRDVSSHRETLEEIRRQANRAEALVQVASRLNSQLELEIVLTTICEVTNRAVKATGTAVLLPGARQDLFQGMAAISGDPALTAYKGTQIEIPRGVFEAILSSDNPVVVIDGIQEHPELPYFQIYKNTDIRTLAIAGLFRGGSLTGVLVSAFSRQSKILLDDETALLKGLADQASSAIVNAELFEQVRAGRERQRKLAKNLVDVQETERRRIARELHDHLGQILTGLQFMLESAKSQAAGTQRTNIEEIQDAVTGIIREVREMSLSLRPSMLDDMGLIPTLLWHFHRYTNQTGIHVNFRYDPFPGRIPTEIETAAYRIVQEALTNVARHARVKEVFVGLVIQDETLWVEILDNGKGFDTSAGVNNPSTGLSGMQERASLLGGYLLVESYIDQGTQILAALPVTDRPLERRKHERHYSAGR